MSNDQHFKKALGASKKKTNLINMDSYDYCEQKINLKYTKSKFISDVGGEKERSTS